jgi:two-component system OmpR family response regulator
MLSARGEDVDRIVGLEMGADDYLVKPFHPRELLARIKSVLRRGHLQNESSELEVVRFGQWMFDRTRRLLYAIDEKASQSELRQQLKTQGEGLNTIEYRLLKALTDHPQRVLSRDFLLDATLGREHIPHRPHHRCADEPSPPAIG